MTVIKDKAWNGIYFLYLNSELQYIGKSKTVYSRFLQHPDIKFDTAVIFPCPNDTENFQKENLKYIEERLIYLYSPPYNTQHNKGANAKIPFSKKLQEIVDYYGDTWDFNGEIIERQSAEMPQSNSTKDIVEWIIDCEQDSQRQFNLYCKLRENADADL